MGISIQIDSRAYVHNGGTKYYRLAAVTVTNGGKSVCALLTNYGKYSGDLSKHKPMHGGTSSSAHLSSAITLSRKMNSEATRRTGSRGYIEDEAHRFIANDKDITELELQDYLRGKVGMIAAHYDEILEEVGLRSPATSFKPATAADDMKELISSARKGMADKHGIMPDGSRKPPKAPKPMPAEATELKPAAPVVERDRGAIWGSW